MDAFKLGFSQLATLIDELAAMPYELSADQAVQRQYFLLWVTEVFFRCVKETVSLLRSHERNDKNT